jgi:hypothetical protein
MAHHYPIEPQRNGGGNSVASIDGKLFVCGIACLLVDAMPPKKRTAKAGGGDGTMEPPRVRHRGEAPARLTLNAPRVHPPESSIEGFLLRLTVADHVSAALTECGTRFRAGSARKTDEIDFGDWTNRQVAVAALALALARRTMDGVVRELQERRGSTVVPDFFDSFTLHFTAEQQDTLRRCGKLFFSVVPLSASDEPGNDDGLTTRRGLSTWERRFERLCSLRRTDTLRRHIRAAITGATDRPRDDDGALLRCVHAGTRFVPLGSDAAHIANVTPVSGLIASSRTRRIAVSRLLAFVTGHEGLPPFLRSCRIRGPAPGGSSTTAAASPNQEPAGVHREETAQSIYPHFSELPASQFAVTGSRQADVNRELRELASRHWTWLAAPIDAPAALSLLEGLAGQSDDDFGVLSDEMALRLQLQPMDQVSARSSGNSDAYALIAVRVAAHDTNMLLALGVLRVVPAAEVAT